MNRNHHTNIVVMIIIQWDKIMFSEKMAEPTKIKKACACNVWVPQWKCKKKEEGRINGKSKEVKKR